MGRTESLLVLAVMALVGASSVSAVQLGLALSSIGAGAPGIDASAVALIRSWVFVQGAAVVCGLAGGYCVLRFGEVRQPLLLLFLILYAFTLRVDSVSLGWPWQLHIGLVVGRTGLGVNIVGLVLLILYLKLSRRTQGKASSPEINSTIN